MPLPVAHPVVKTETEIRRSIQRLEVFRSSNGLDNLVVNGTINNVLNHLRNAYKALPDEMRE